MPDNISDKWQRQDKQPVSDRLKETVVTPPPMRDRLELAKKKLSEEIRQLDRISERLTSKDKSIYEGMVKAYEDHDIQKAQALSTELAELRKVESRTQYGKFALERAYTKIEMAKDFGDVVAALVPVNQIVKNVKGTLSEFLPSTSTALGEISSMMSEMQVSFSSMSTSVSIMNPPSEEADKILQEAAALAESRLKDKLPPTETRERLNE